MRLLVYEFITGGGCYSWPDVGLPSGTLLTEGAAMRSALAADLERLGHQVETLHDRRLPAALQCGNAHVVGDAADERRRLAQRAAAVDGVLLIAPETRGALAQRAGWVAEAGGWLLSPAADWIALAADKRRCLDRLRSRGLPTVTSHDPSADPGDSSGPWLSKPRDGCGSMDLRRVETREAAARELAAGRVVERIAPGCAASVAVLCGPAGHVPLVPCEQQLDSGFRYLGGRAPLPRPGQAARARRLAADAIEALGPTNGYAGVDLVLADDAVSGSRDLVVEVNPRLTTSYVGLRRLYGESLAAAMLDAAAGVPVNLVRCAEAVRFTAAGDVEVV